ncbi:MAG: RuBisCO large subunit C-terminal-like domain-containing protein [Pseudomonadota bacterium]
MASGDRSRVTYLIVADGEAAARARAVDIAYEQTVEVPDDVVPDGYIRDEIVGQVETIEAAPDGRWRAVISYSPDSVGSEAVQLLNVMFGNSSIQQGIAVAGFEPGPVIAERFAGARFGVAGLRRLTGTKRGGLISPVIKPQGSSAAALAEIAGRCVAGGADIIKDDHGLTNQAMAPFDERLRRVGDAVKEANAKHSRSALYFVNISGWSGNPVEEAFLAKEQGVGGVLIMPGLLGYALAHRLSSDPAFGLPIMTHPSFTGPFVLHADTGMSHAMLYGTVQRLMGSDISVFPNVGGRFGFSRDECLSIAAACRDGQGIGAPMMPSPGGGMSVDRAADMVSMYGEDVVFLIGGSLLRSGAQIGDAVRAMRDAVDAALG